MSASLTRFTDDPLTSDRARFPLARPMGTPENSDSPSSDAVRPWGLRAMETLPGTGQQITTGRYDHGRQVAVDGNGNTTR